MSDDATTLTAAMLASIVPLGLTSVPLRRIGVVSAPENVSTGASQADARSHRPGRTAGGGG